jgi:hypothetical protein
MNAVTPLLTIQIDNTRQKSSQIATCRNNSPLTGDDWTYWDIRASPRANHQKGFHSRTTP